MDDPFDRGRWPLPRLAEELDDLAARTRPPDGSIDPAGADWAIDHLLDGASPRELCEAALWVGLRRGRADGRGPTGLVTHAVVAAAACAAAGSGTDDRVAALAAVQHVAYTLGAYRGGVNDVREGPSLLGWYEPHPTDDDPVQAFLNAAAAGETDLSDHCWLTAAAAEPEAAEVALICAGAAGYHLNEHKLVYPAQLRAWIGEDAPLDPVLFRAAARYVGNHVQDRTRSDTRRADAAALAVDAEERGPVSTAMGGDLERISVVATGIARTPPRGLARLMIGSLADGLDPADLVQAVSLVTATRFSATPFGDLGPIGASHAGTGTNAIRRCLSRADSHELRYELAICSTESPHLAGLADIEELSVPPSDDGALDDLLDALAAGDPDAASDAACAVPPGDPDSVATAWSAVLATGATDQWMLLHGIKHAVAMREDFEASRHPARIWYLAAAARTAAHATAMDQPVAREVERRLG